MTKFSSSILFLTAILILAGCASKSDIELMDSANRNIKQEKYVEAISDFETLINEYPQSRLAPKATFEIGKIYQGQLIKNISQTESFELAIKHYLTIVDKYSDDSNAPNSLFMVGFIQANELKMYDDAKETYKLFMEKYPDSELTVSAQAEIDNLGLSPEEILKQKMSTIQK